jgi:hypothetical protein
VLRAGIRPARCRREEQGAARADLGLVVRAQAVTADAREMRQYLLGGVYVLTILYLPGGLIGIPARVRNWHAHSRDRGEPKKAEFPSH